MLVIQVRPAPSVVPKPHPGLPAFLRWALMCATRGVRCCPCLKTQAEQLTWKVKHIRRGNDRSYSLSETAAADLTSYDCTQSCLVRASSLGLKGAWLNLREVQVWVPPVRARRKILNDEVHAGWEGKGFKNPNPNSVHFSHFTCLDTPGRAGWWRWEGKVA